MSYLGPSPVGSARPSVGVGYYRPRGPTSPVETLAVEDTANVRDPFQKHRWLDTLAGDLETLLEHRAMAPAFAAWHSEPRLERLAARFGGIVLAVPAETRSALEDKTALDRILYAAGVPAELRIPTLTVRRMPSFRSLARQLGSRLVVQSAWTSGGRGTYFVDSEPALAQAGTESAGPWRVSRHVEGFASNTTALTVPTGRGCTVYVDVPSHKPVGVEALGIAPAKGAGNDWSPAWPLSAVGRFITAVSDLGRYAYDRYGLMGLWGVDALWNGDQVVINEINVRNQGTTELSGVNQILQGLPPLVVAHLTVLAGGRVDWLGDPDKFNTTSWRVAVSTSRSPYHIKLRNRRTEPVTPTAAWRGPGVYQLTDNSKLSWLREGAHPLDADLDVGEVLVANAPAPGVRCGPGAELGTAEGITSRPVFDSPHTLSPLGASIAEAAHASFVPYEEELPP